MKRLLLACVIWALFVGVVCADSLSWQDYRVWSRWRPCDAMDIPIGELALPCPDLTGWENSLIPATDGALTGWELSLMLGGVDQCQP